MAGYNISRSVEDLLTKHESSPPSFTVHLYTEHWTLNNHSKFLYTHQVAVCSVRRPFRDLLSLTLHGTVAAGRYTCAEDTYGLSRAV